MRVLLDENVPFDLVRELSGYETVTVQQLGWSGLRNGALLQRAAGSYDVFLTMDSNLEYQQQLSGRPFGVIIVRARSNRMVHLRPLIPVLRQALAALKPGEVRRVGG